MVIRGRARGLNREDTEPITFYESTPEKNIVKLETFVRISATTLRLYFSTPLKETANLLSPSTYSITGPTTLTVTAVARYKQKKVDLTFSGVVANGVYRVTILKPITGINGVEMLKGNRYREKDKEIISQRPSVVSATANSATTITILFSEAMLENTALITTTNYVVTGPTVLTTTLITRINATTVRLTTNEMLNGGAYIVTVSNVADLVGDTIDTAHNSASFTGVGVAPQMSSATATAVDTVRVAFNEAMSDTGLTTNINYSFTCPVGATITVSNVTKISSAIVDITIAGEMLIGVNNYTVTVVNVTDFAGNPIDVAHNSSAFNGLGIQPKLTSAAATSATKVRVTFDSAMNITQLETFTNYTFDNGVTSSAATKVGAGPTYTQVDVTVTAMSDGINYTVTGDSALVDLVGNPLDGSFDTFLFAGDGYPQVSGATALDTSTVRVTYNKAMLDGAIEIESRYFFTISPSLSISTFRALDIDTTSGTNMIVGDFQKLLYTTSDFGAHWRTRFPGGLSNASWYAVALNSSGATMLAANYSGLVYVSYDSGVTWTSCSFPAGVTTASWRTVNMSQNATYMSAGGSGTRFYISANSGSSWTAVDFPLGVTNGSWLSSSIDSDGSFFITANFGGLVYISSNSGANWSSCTFPGGVTTANWVAVAANFYGTYLLAGAQAGRAYLSSDSGANWSEITFPGGVTVGNWWAMACNTSGQYMIAANTAGNVFTSSNYGASWTARTIDGAVTGWQRAAINATGSHMIITRETKCYLSTNYGVDWAALSFDGAAIDVALATKISTTQVDLTIAGEMKTGVSNYGVTVNSVFDTHGNTIDPAHNTATFSGLGTSPQVSSADYITDTKHVDVVFSESMADNAALVDATNYVITGASTPVIDSATRIDATTVRLATATYLPLGVHTVTVATTGITDLAGNTIDPAHDDTNFSWTGVSDHPSLPTGLIAYYAFNDTLNDSLGVLNGSAEGDPEYVAGKVNKAVFLDGNDCVNCSTNAAFQPNNVTVSCWIYGTAMGTDDCFFSKSGNSGHFGYILQRRLTKLRFAVSTNDNDANIRTVDSVGDINDGTWYHCAGSFDGTNMNVYLNGVKATAVHGVPGNISTLSSAAAALIGVFTNNAAYPGGRIDYLKGNEGEVAIWSRALSDDEMADLYNAGTGITY